VWIAIDSLRIDFFLCHGHALNSEAVHRWRLRHHPVDMHIDHGHPALVASHEPGKHDNLLIGSHLGQRRNHHLKPLDAIVDTDKVPVRCPTCNDMAAMPREIVAGLTVEPLAMECGACGQRIYVRAPRARGVIVR